MTCYTATQLSPLVLLNLLCSVFLKYLVMAFPNRGERHIPSKTGRTINTMLFMLMRVVFTLLGGYIGILGILLGAMFVVSYVVSLDQFGTPYLAPVAPSITNDKMDALYKKPLQDLQQREASAMSIRGQD